MNKKEEILDFIKSKNLIVTRMEFRKFLDKNNITVGTIRKYFGSTRKLGILCRINFLKVKKLSHRKYSKNILF